MGNTKILVTGANGQLGTVLTQALRDRYGINAVVATDIRPAEHTPEGGIFELLSVTDAKAMGELAERHGITQIYHLAAVLSAKGEENPIGTWHINMDGVLHVLELARERGMDKVYFPSSIAVFGASTPRVQTPQDCVRTPSTVYGISKLTGENWGYYYFMRYGLDVRSLRYPGIISHETLPGGGTTDYAVDIYYKAVLGERFSCFLSPNTKLPMMYMPDAIRATLELMEAPAERIKQRMGYNLTAMSFSPSEVFHAIAAEVPDFRIDYEPDPLRQRIADSWPQSIDDSAARNDWNWQEEFDLEAMTKEMLFHLRLRLL